MPDGTCGGRKADSSRYPEQHALGVKVNQFWFFLVYAQGLCCSTGVFTNICPDFSLAMYSVTEREGKVSPFKKLFHDVPFSATKFHHGLFLKQVSWCT